MNLRVLILAFLFFLKASFAIHYNITTLPGYDGPLPVLLESGYVTVGENEELQLFYLYAASDNPTKDPILFWGPGGPGYSGLTSLFLENGPLKIDYKDYPWDGSMPKIVFDDDFRWTKYFNMIYLDAPAGVGYSYSTTQEGWYTSDIKFAQNWDEFCRKWFGEEHPELQNNSLYLGGDGYLGNQVAITIKQIYDGNIEGRKPFINIKGFALSSPGADFDIDFNAKYTYANRYTFIPDAVYQEADNICGGNFTKPPNEECKKLVNAMDDIILNINTVAILEPACRDVFPYLKLESEDSNAAPRFLEEDYEYQNTSQYPTRPCRKYKSELLSVWANNKTFQQALHVAEGRSFFWQTSNKTVQNGGAYEHVDSVLGYYKNFTKLHMRGLILSGDHSMECPFIGTHKWVSSLGVPQVLNWTAVTINKETAGYALKYSNGHFNLTLTTVKGAGHFGAEDMPAECFEIVRRWLVSDTVVESD